MPVRIEPSPSFIAAPGLVCGGDNYSDAGGPTAPAAEMHYADSVMLYRKTVNGCFVEAEQALRRVKCVGNTQQSSALRRLPTTRYAEKV